MGTKRATIERDAKVRITPEIVGLYRIVREIEEDGLEDIHEDEGGRWLEHQTAVRAFHQMIGYQPTEISPLQVDDMIAPGEGEPGAEDWKKADAVRRRLEAAAA